MLGIIVQLAISWLLLWLFERKDIRVLGLFPTKKRLADLALFFLAAAVCCSSGFLMRMAFTNQQWILNPKLTADQVMDGIWWNIKSVMFEELIFRGAILYILVKRIGATRA